MNKLLPFNIKTIDFSFKNTKITNFDRYVDKHPFVPSNPLARDERCKEIFNIQCSALAKRLEHTNLKKAVIGISGGLDSTLALLVIVKTFDMLGINHENIITITMPGFGTTDRTYNNALTLCRELNCDLREINIVKAVCNILKTLVMIKIFMMLLMKMFKLEKELKYLWILPTRKADY